MIPKIIHYCWFGHSELPKISKKCIESWKKFLPDYEIKEWNETNFDVNNNEYSKEAYMCKKYAFVSDFARFYILYNYGGIYLDIDVELINGIDDIIEKGPFIALETGEFKSDIKQNVDIYTGLSIDLGFSINPGLILCLYKNHSLCKDIISEYNKRHFCDDNGRFIELTICDFITGLLVRKGISVKNGFGCVDDITIYPKDYFSPKDPDSEEIVITENTRSIHHYEGSWYNDIQKRIHKIIFENIKKYGYKKGRKIAQIKALPYSIVNKIQKFGFIGTLKLVFKKSNKL